MHADDHLVSRRVSRAIRERFRPAVVADTASLYVTSWQAESRNSSIKEALAARFEPHEAGQPWGPPWATTWFRIEGLRPAAWAGRRVEARIDLGFDARRPGFQAEGMVYGTDCLPIKGVAPRNHHVPLPEVGVDDASVLLLVEAAANPQILTEAPEGDDFRWRFTPTLLGDEVTAGPEPLYQLGQVDLVLIDEDVRHLVADVDALLELTRVVPASDPRHHEVLRALDLVIDIVDRLGVAAGATEARAILEPLLAAPAGHSTHILYAVGHAHIDCAWLWPLEETERKVSRTFANVMQLMDEHEGFVFTASQAQQYAWVKRRHPAIYERLREAVRAGRWAPIGGMWVEADANLPGGEAMARQFTHGQRFFRDEFGVECDVVWLPDSFGYSAALPQIATLAGARWFLTQKLSWNESNRFPHHTFWWEGIDGTRIFTHFPPVDTYSAELTGDELRHAVATFAEKGNARRSLVPFGYGDGGGGPTAEMLARAQRFADLEGAPRVRLASPGRFFEDAEEEYPDAPAWRGELYLESHRGTFTSQAHTKAGNRRSEQLLREAELWATTATVTAGVPYPFEELDQLWKAVLLHQFHDILPGSSISQVHREAQAAYDRIGGRLEVVIETALRPFAGSGALVANPAPVPRREVVTVDVGQEGDDAGVSQALRSGGRAVLVEVAADGIAPCVPVVPDDGVVVDERMLANGHVRVDLDDDGLITRLHDRHADREVVPAGRRANVLRVHPDHPARWDAWDLDRAYRNSAEWLTATDRIEIVEEGPLVGAIRIERRFGRSTVAQEIRLTAGSPRIDLVTEVDWAEDDRLLKLELPIDVHPDRAAAEIQFGHIDRPIHDNTSWDAARFETYGHRWLHVGEDGYGVAVVNRTVYGHDVTSEADADGNRITTVAMSLLRASRFPDPQADRGRHRFVIGLVPGAGLAEAADHGLALNLPLRVLPPAGGSIAEDGYPAPMVEATHPGVEVDAVKLADDGSGDLVVRLHERLGGRHKSRLRLGVEVASATACDLLERPREELTVRQKQEVELSLRPFQILTVRLALGRREGVDAA